MASNDSEKRNKAVHSLWKGNLLRKQAEKVVGDPQAIIEDVQPIVSAFRSRPVLNGSKYSDAIWLIESAPLRHDQRAIISEKLSVLLDVETKSSRSGSRMLKWLWRCVIAYSLLNLSDFLCGVYFPYLPMAAVVVVYISAVFVPLWWFHGADKCRSRSIIEALGELGEPSSTASIALALRHSRLRDAARSALTSVVSNLRPDHYGVLSSRAVPALCRAIPKVDHSITLVILNALNIIGDARAIGSVEHLVVKPPSAEIYTTAYNLLPILRQRDLESKSSTQLHRPSNSREQGQTELLRGVSGANLDDPLILLRAPAGEND